MKRRTLGLLAATPAAALLVAGCSAAPGGDSTPLAGGSAALSPVAAVSQAADASAEVGSARMTLNVVVNSGIESFTIDGEGAYDHEAEVAEFRVSIPAQPGLPIDLGDIQFRVVGDVAYMNMGALTGGSWVELDPEELENSGLLEGGGLGGSLDPDAVAGFETTDALAVFRAATDDTVLVSDDEVIAGVPTSHYRGSVDLAAALDALPQELLGEIPQDLEVADPTYDLWVDDQNRIVRAVLNISVPATPEAGFPGGTVTVTLNQSDFGKPVNVQAPDESDIVDFEDMLGGLVGPGAALI